MADKAFENACRDADDCFRAVDYTRIRVYDAFVQFRASEFKGLHGKTSGLKEALFPIWNISTADFPMGLDQESLNMLIDMECMYRKVEGKFPPGMALNPPAFFTCFARGQL